MVLIVAGGCTKRSQFTPLKQEESKDSKVPAKKEGSSDIGL